jgi:hypothetical protein
LGAGAAIAAPASTLASKLVAKPKQSARRRKLTLILILAVEGGRLVAIALCT